MTTPAAPTPPSAGACSPQRGQKRIYGSTPFRTYAAGFLARGGAVPSIDVDNAHEQSEQPKQFGSWEEIRDYVRAGGTLPSQYPDGGDGNRTELEGVGRSATTEEIVRYLDGIHSMTAEECDDPDRIVALINRCGGDCIWDYEAGRVVPRPRNVSP